MKKSEITAINNFWYKIGAVALALLLWFYVLQTQNTVGERLLEIPLETRELSSNLVVADMPSQVSVRVKGPKQILEQLGTQDIRAYIVLENAVEGQRTESVHLILPDKVEKISVNPASVTINIEQISTMQLPVEVIVKGDLQEGYTALTASVTPTEAIVSGPQSKLDEIKSVTVEANLTGIDANYLQKLPVVINMTNNEKNNNLLTVSPAEVAVFIPVVEDMPSKQVPVTARINGSPASDYIVSRVVVEPSVVKILGAYNIIDSITYLYTEDVDINGATRDITVQSNLILPDGVQIDGESTVNVFIQIEHGGDKSFSDVPIEIRNLGEAFNGSLDVASTDITLAAAPAILQALEKGSIHLFVDANELTVGEHTVTVQMEAMDSISLVRMEIQEVKLTISEK